MKRLFGLLCLVLWLPVGMPLWAQTPPEAAALLRAWLAGQSEQARSITEITFMERATRLVDGRFGQQRMDVESRVTGEPQTFDWQRTIHSLLVNGKEPPPKRRANMERRWHNPAQPEFNRLLHAVILPLRTWNQVAPIGPPTEEVVDGVACWRFEVAPRRANVPFDRITVWLDKNQGHLVRTRAIFHGRSPEATITALTDYQRIEGIDVPRRRHFEGTVKTRRREGFFTSLVELDATYSEYAFSYE